jgi:hypothetical protein
MDEILLMKKIMDNVLEDLDFFLSFHRISSIKKMIFHGYSAIEHG